MREQVAIRGTTPIYLPSKIRDHRSMVFNGYSVYAYVKSLHSGSSFYVHTDSIQLNLCAEAKIKVNKFMKKLFLMTWANSTSRPTPVTSVSIRVTIPTVPVPTLVYFTNFLVAFVQNTIEATGYILLSHKIGFVGNITCFLNT